VSRTMNSTSNAFRTIMTQWAKRTKPVPPTAFDQVMFLAAVGPLEERMGHDRREKISCQCSHFHADARRMVESKSNRGFRIGNQKESTFVSLHADDDTDDNQREAKTSFMDESVEDDDIDEGIDDEGGEDHKVVLMTKSTGRYEDHIDSDEHFETLIRKYLNIYEQYNDDSIIISQHDAEEIRSCLAFLETRARSKRLSREDVDRSFQGAHISEKLLNLLIIAIPSHQTMSKDHKDRFVMVEDFNQVLTIWKYTTKGLKKYFHHRYEEVKDIKEHFKQVLQYQRRIACRCIFASERTEKLLNEMNRLSVEGYSYLRPTQYTYECVLGSWSLSSRELSFMLRGEGKAAGALQKVYPRYTLNHSHPELANNPWDDPSILDQYKLLDPAKKADEILESLFTLEELDSTEFRVSPWAIERTLASWVHVKIRPRRFTHIKSKPPQVDIVDEDELDYEAQEELYVPARAEELMWRLFDLSQSNSEDIRPLRNSIFRSVISSWSHSNHPNGHHNAERILTKMGELYDMGKLSSMPTPDIFNAVIGSWARRSQSMPLDAPSRCVAILKHMEQIADSNMNLDTHDNDQQVFDVHQKWKDFCVDEKTYHIVFGAFKSALHSKLLNTSDSVFDVAYQADDLLQHLTHRCKMGKEEATPSGEIYAIVAKCYGKAIELLSNEISRDDEVLKETDVGFICVHHQGTEKHLLSALKRLNLLLDEMERGDGSHISDLSINTYLEVLKAWVNATVIPDSEREALQIFQRVKLMGHPNLLPSAEMYDLTISALLRRKTSNNSSEALELLKEQERLHLEGNPSYKPSIKLYRSMLAAFKDRPDEFSFLLNHMTMLYESNVIDELQDKNGSTTLGFNEILELWTTVEDSESDAASWGESMLLKVAGAVYSSNARCPDSTKILRTTNFNTVIKTWLEAGKLHRAESLLDEMERLSHHRLLNDIKPDHLSFHSLIRNMIEDDLSHAEVTAERLLQRMRTCGKIPNHLTYHLILDSMVKSSRGQANSILKAEKLLKNIESASFATTRHLRPNTKLTNILLQGWVQSTDNRKGVMARKLLEWMLSEYQNGNSFIKPNSSSYNLVMKACIKSSKFLRPQQKKRNFEIVQKTFEELTRSQNARPGVISYRIMLTASQLLLPEGPERQSQVKKVFDDCCRMGLVDEIAYSIFLDIGDDNTVSSTFGQDVITWAKLPIEWKRNGLSHRDEHS